MSNNLEKNKKTKNKTERKKNLIWGFSLLPMRKDSTPQRCWKSCGTSASYLRATLSQGTSGSLSSACCPLPLLTCLQSMKYMELLSPSTSNPCFSRLRASTAPSSTTDRPISSHRDTHRTALLGRWSPSWNWTESRGVPSWVVQICWSWVLGTGGLTTRL